MANLHVDWFKNIPSSDKTKREEMEKTVRNSTIVLQRLQDIIKERDSILVSSMKKEHNFESPVWAHNQAYNLGKLAVYEELLQLLGFLNNK